MRWFRRRSVRGEPASPAGIPRVRERSSARPRTCAGWGMPSPVSRNVTLVQGMLNVYYFFFTRIASILANRTGIGDLRPYCSACCVKVTGNNDILGVLRCSLRFRTGKAAPMSYRWRFLFSWSRSRASSDAGGNCGASQCTELLQEWWGDLEL